MIVRIEARLVLGQVLARREPFCPTMARDACSLDPMKSLRRFIASVNSRSKRPLRRLVGEAGSAIQGVGLREKNSGSRPCLLRARRRHGPLRLFIWRYAAASASVPCFALNASHAVLNCCLASSRLAALPNGGPGMWTLDVPDPDAGIALAREADAADLLPVFEHAVIAHADQPQGPRHHRLVVARPTLRAPTS